MKRIFAIFLLTALANISWAQKVKYKYSNSGDIRTLTGSNHHTGFFGALTFKGTKLHNEELMMAGFKGGLTINRTVAIGIEGHGIIPSNQYETLYPQDDVVALGGYGGLFIEPILFSNSAIHLTFPVSGGAGWLGFHESWRDDYNRDGELIEGDVFWYTEAGANVEFNITRHLRFGAGISKRFVQDLNLDYTKSDDFSRLNYNLTLKIGRF